MFATTTDISTRLGRPYASADEQLQVQAWIDDLEALILERIPGIITGITDGAPSAQTVMAVVCAAVIRKINNPTGKLQERIDDYSYGLTAVAASAELDLTPEEWARLTPAAPSGAFSIRPGYDSGATDWAW